MPRGLRVFWVAFGAFFLVLAAWSFASPLGSAPDEPAQLIRAASLVRGQLVGHDLPGATKGQGSFVVVQVPEVFASLANDVGCFKEHPRVPAGCQAPLVPSPQDQPVESYVGRYPPLYYAITGWPTLVWVSVSGIYASRLASAALSAAMLALAVVSAGRAGRRPLLPAGVTLATTPMVVYLGGALNPSGFEASCGVALFAGGVALAAQGGARASQSDLARFGASALCLVLLRALSPLWAVVAVAVVCVLAGWTGTLALLRRRAVQVWLGAGVLAGAVAGVWDLAAGGLRLQPGTAVPAHAGALTVAHLALERLHLVAVSSIGIFGWLDTSSPFGVVTAWALALLALVVLALVSTGGRQRALVAALVALWVVVTYAFIVAMVPTHGLVGQGRDFLALAAAGPIVAGACALPERLPAAFARRVPVALGVLFAVFAVGQVADFYGTLRRYTVGVAGPFDAFAHVAGGWSPVVPGPVLVAAFVVGTLGVVGVCAGVAAGGYATHLPTHLVGPGGYGELAAKVS